MARPPPPSPFGLSGCQAKAYTQQIDIHLGGSTNFSSRIFKSHVYTHTTTKGGVCVHVRLKELKIILTCTHTPPPKVVCVCM